jgi:hypothetical protein
LEFSGKRKALESKAKPKTETPKLGPAVYNGLKELGRT